MYFCYADPLALFWPKTPPLSSLCIFPGIYLVPVVHFLLLTNASSNLPWDSPKLFAFHLLQQRLANRDVRGLQEQDVSLTRKKTLVRTAWTTWWAASRLTPAGGETFPEDCTYTPCHRSWASPMQQHLSVVPYQGHGSGRPHGCGYCSGDCCAPFYPSHCSQQSLQVALPMPSNIEERLRALEGDKDQLHIQVLTLSKNCI